MISLNFWLLLVTIVAGPMAAGPLTATWSTKIMTPDGEEYALQLVLVQNGASVGGYMVGKQGVYPDSGVVGTVEGNKVTMSGKLDGVPISFTGTINARSGYIEMTTTVNGNEYSTLFTAPEGYSASDAAASSAAAEVPANEAPAPDDGEGDAGAEGGDGGGSNSDGGGGDGGGDGN